MQPHIQRAHLTPYLMLRTLEPYDEMAKDIDSHTGLQL